MTPEQRNMARHALGLDNPDAKKKSYRNRYFASGAIAREWDKMVDAGEAEFHPSTASMLLYVLTRSGAEAALNPGERLDREDFPD